MQKLKPINEFNRSVNVIIHVRLKNIHVKKC